MVTHTPSTPARPRTEGVVNRWRTRIFGERDAIREQLAEVARQGSGMAHLAHACAFALVVLFSLGSLVALSGEQLTRIIRMVETGQGLDIPAAISVAVSTLLVCCFDVGMVYAALKVRMLRARRQGAEAWPHIVVMIVVCAIEAGTYLYMSVTYDSVTSAAVLALIVARAVSAPVMSIYLSMAAPSPVSARDVLYQTELAVGEGLIRDAVTVARDTSAPLARKMRLYKAASPMSPDDRARLDGMIAVMADATGTNTPPDAARASDRPLTAPQDGTDAAQSAQGMNGKPDAPAPLEPHPTGPGTPSRAPRRSVQKTAAPVLRLTPERTARPTRSKPAASWESEARRAWADGARSIRAMREQTGMSQQAASKWVGVLKASAANAERAAI